MLEKFGAGEGDSRGQNCWMASLTNGFEYEQTAGDGEGQEGVICCSPWDYKELG